LTWTFDPKNALKGFNLIVNANFNDIPFNSSQITSEHVYQFERSIFSYNHGHLQYVHSSFDPSYGSSSIHPDDTPSSLPNDTLYGTSYGTPMQMEIILIVMDVYP
jgi:hypothetical protein